MFVQETQPGETKGRNINTKFRDQGTMIAPDYRKMFPHIPGHKCAHREADNRVADKGVIYSIIPKKKKEENHSGE